GFPTGQEPPEGSLVGLDTVRGPPPGEPPIVIIRPPTPGVPCLPGSPDCTPSCDPAVDPDCPEPEEVIKGCAWHSPNSAGKPAGKPIPCGRISWKQIR